MIHPTRTNLLRLKDRQRAIHRSLTILKARRQALITEFLKLGETYIDRRKQLARLYADALNELSSSLKIEGDSTIDAIASATERFKGVDTEPGNILGIPFLTISTSDQLPRPVAIRPYDLAAHSEKLNRGVRLFEELSAAIIEHASLESRVRRLAAAIRETTRVMRTLEDRILPRQQMTIEHIRFFLAEREREAQFRLRKFKQFRASN